MVGSTRKLLLWAKAHKQLDHAKVDELVHKAVRNFTLHYASASKKGGGLLGRSAGPSLPLSDACRLLRGIQAPSAVSP